ncbi:unnamed protein product, partial [Rotaria sp. Silwood1]
MGTTRLIDNLRLTP